MFVQIYDPICIVYAPDSKHLDSTALKSSFIFIKFGLELNLEMDNNKKMH